MPDYDSDFDINAVLTENSFSERRVHIWGEIDSTLALGIIEQLNYHYNKNPIQPITILIHSPGGETDSAMSIVDEMETVKESGVELITVAVGMAYSAGAIILSMGTKGCRFAKPNASIMLHPCSYSLSYDYASYQQKLSEFLKRNTDDLNKKVGEACGYTDKTYHKFLKDIDKGLWMTAQEAVDYGVIDAVLNKPLCTLGGNKTNAIKKTSHKRRL